MAPGGVAEIDGTTLGFADGGKPKDGDTFESEAAPFGLPLHNPLAVAPALSGAVAVKPL